MKKLLVLISIFAISAMTFAQVKPQTKEVKKDTQKEIVRKDSLRKDSLRKDVLKKDALKKNVPKKDSLNMKENNFNQPPVKKDTTKIKK